MVWRNRKISGGASTRGLAAWGWWWSLNHLDRKCLNNRMSGPVEGPVHSVNTSCRSTSNMWCRQAIQRRGRWSKLSRSTHAPERRPVLDAIVSKHIPTVPIPAPHDSRSTATESAVSLPVLETSLGTPGNLVGPSSELVRSPAMRSTSWIPSSVSIIVCHPNVQQIS